MNGFELSETFSRILGRPMKYEKMKSRDEAHRQMADWLENNKFMVDVEKLNKNYNVKMKSVEDFIRENRQVFQ
jgi:hypothetical protein